MINQLAKLFTLAAASIPCAGFAVMPDAAIHEDGVTARSVLLNSSRLVSNEELSQMRGGFFTAAGAQFDFGASVQTMVNGKLALLTNVQWTPAGAVTQQLQGLGASIQAQVANTVANNLAKAGIATPGTAMQTNNAVVTDSPTTKTLATPMSATNTANSAPATNGSVSNAPAAPAATMSSTSLAANPPAASSPAISSPAISSPATSAPVTSTPAPASAPASTLASVPVSAPVIAPVSAPVSASSAGDAAPMVITGIQIPGATGGSTQVFANVGAGQIQNIILNSASGQDISQNTNVTLTIYNFAAWQQQVAQHMLSARLANDMLAASGISAGH